MIDNILITNLKKIEVKEGNVLHFMKASEDGFSQFGEAYFSKIKYKKIKGWKRHKKMTLNLAVPIGSIKFVFAKKKYNNYEFNTVILSEDNYQRITVPPLVWMGFQGLGEEESLLLNIANIEHDPDEAEKLDIEDIPYLWNKN